MISGVQRLRNVKTKVRIIAERNLRDFMKGKIGFLPEWQTDKEIVREFDRLSNLLSTKRGDND